MQVQLKIDYTELNILFPFHFVLNKDLHIIYTGQGLEKISPVRPGDDFSAFFRIKEPLLSKKYSFELLTQHLHQPFILELTGKENKVPLRGQMIVTGNGELFFAGSPWIVDLHDLCKFGLSVPDFAIHDPVTDMLQALEVKERAMQDVQEQRDELIRKNQEIEDLARFPSENPNPVFRISLTGKIRYANKASEELLSAWDCKVGDNYPEVLRPAMRHTVRTSASLETEIEIKDRYYTLLFTPFLENGYINVYGSDITEKKRTENTLKESEERFKQLVEGASDIIYRTDFEGNFIYANPVAERIIKKRSGEITGVHFSDLIREDWREEVVRFYQLQFAKRIPMTYYEFPIIDSKGKETWLGQNVKMLSQGNMIVGFQAVARDITERKRMEESLKMAKERAEESLRIKEDFMANMSHEIRTPMNGILGMSKLLASADLSEKHRQFLNAIQTSANNLLVIINDILDLSKIEAGKLDLEVIGFNVSEVVQGAIGSLEYSAGEKGLSLSTEIDPRLNELVLQGDPLRLGQVLTNLVSNAIKFTEAGNVKLKCELLHEDKYHLRIMFSVSDTGIGISPDKLQSIFESFSQADSSTTRKYGGTGLGLAICKKLIELQGGTINVESQESIGSSFYFDIPFLKEGGAHLPENSENLGFKYDLRGIRVLLVEDHSINQVYATNIMQEKGMVVDLAENGVEALNLLQKKEYDIVLMDIQMPVMGGIETTRLIRNRLRLKVPIIALTANAIKGEAEKYLSVGMNEYISKPFKDTELFNKVARLLQISPLLTQRSRSIQHEQTKPSADTRMYDLTKLQQMSGSKQEFVNKMVRMFIEEIPKALHVLNEHMANCEYDRVKAVAHKMKPAIHIMGMEAIQGDVQRIEEYAASKDHLDELPRLVGYVTAACEKTLNQLKVEFP